MSGELLEMLVKETGGDSAKLQIRIQELMRNPASLEQKLTPEQRQRLKDMAKEITPPLNVPH